MTRIADHDVGQVVSVDVANLYVAGTDESASQLGHTEGIVADDIRSDANIVNGGCGRAGVWVANEIEYQVSNSAWIQSRYVQPNLSAFDGYAGCRGAYACGCEVDKSCGRWLVGEHKRVGEAIEQ